jgi:hypothetical protein
MSGFQLCAFSQASTPSLAVAVEYPQPETSYASPIKALGSSSAIRTLKVFCMKASKMTDPGAHFAADDPRLNVNLHPIKYQQSERCALGRL